MVSEKLKSSQRTCSPLIPESSRRHVGFSRMSRGNVSTCRREVLGCKRWVEMVDEWRALRTRRLFQERGNVPISWCRVDAYPNLPGGLGLRIDSFVVAVAAFESPTSRPGVTLLSCEGKPYRDYFSESPDRALTLTEFGGP
jgi:hypothetical protein